LDQILGDVIELSIVVRDLEAAVDRYARLFGLKVHRRTESQEFGFKNAILPLGRGHIELLQPTDPSKPLARYLERHGEGVYLVGFEASEIPSAVEHLRSQGAEVDLRGATLAWVHPRGAHGVMVELRRPETYD